MEIFEINSNEIDKLKKISKEEKNLRIKNLNFFKLVGFPNKKLEDWKFSDFNDIINKNFDKLTLQKIIYENNKIELLNDFEHNYICLVNGNLHSSNFMYEDKSKIKINASYQQTELEVNKNPLVSLNNALADNGYFLEVEKNYKFKKILIIYSFFTKELKNEVLNSRNKILLNENAELHLLDYTVNQSKFKFINNVYESITLKKNSKLKNLYLQNNKSEGFFHKFLKSKLFSGSDYSNLIFSSGLKFNKIDIECDLFEENSKCNIMSALFLNHNEHQEIKTRVNHLAPNCQSYQKVKKVLSSESKGIYQGKIYVKDIAQKTNAYQLSKALLLNDKAEFNSKPELEIYADDVKCSHGSTSGSIDENSLYYLMSRGLNREDSTKLLIKGFLSDVLEFIKSETIKKFVETKLEGQINGY
jgi:Fe-S cluster assembly protein SufD